MIGEHAIRLRKVVARAADESVKPGQAPGAAVDFPKRWALAKDHHLLI
jgi:hypothetical protein